MNLTLASLDKHTVRTFASRLRGDLVGPDDAGYDEARKIYNGMIDKRPALIARPVDTADVMTAVDFGRENDLPVAIRGGGHNGGGLGLIDDGLVIDLSLMNGIRVDPEAGTVRAEGGATLGDLDHATHAFGLAVPTGINSTTGIGGLTLGGGLGHLTRKYGLTIDNLLEVDVVLADGSFVTASTDRHPDLFWALRGGGGNFGVATSFLYRAHPQRTVVAGSTFWDMELAREVMRWYRDFIVAAPEDLNGFFAFLTVPAQDPYPAHLHGKRVCGVVWCYTGPASEAAEVFAPIEAFGAPAFHGVEEMPLPALQSAFDPLYPPGYQWYWRGDFIRELSDEAIERHIAYGERLPTPLSTMHLYPIDGAAQRVGKHDTPWNHRDANWAEVIVGVDPDPANASLIKAWTIDYWQAVHPYSEGGGYVNFMMGESRERVRATYGDNYRRLAEIKAMYDPDNFFRVNQNIEPAA